MGDAQPAVKSQDIQFAFAISISPSDLTELAAIFECDQGQLVERLTPYARAATVEYLEMFLGRAPLERVSDIRETRVFAMMVGAFEGKLPAEAVVASVFQVSLAQARSMIQGALTRYQHRLREERAALLKTAFTSIGTDWKKDQDKLVDFASPLVVKELNRIIATGKASAAPIRRNPSTSSQYVVKKSGYDALAAFFTPKPK